MCRFSLILLAFLPLFVTSQTCDCSSNLQWVKKTFEENDAGFAYAMDSKGSDSYKEHTDRYFEKVKEISDPDVCRNTIYEWLQFFRSGHIGLRQITESTANEGTAMSEDAIRSLYKDTERVDLDEDRFLERMATLEQPGYEGVWVSELYKIGVVKQGDRYVGFILEADGVYWTKGQVKFTIQKDGSANYFMRDHSLQQFDSAELLGNNYLQMGFVLLRRALPEIPSDQMIERYFRSISTSQPYFEKVDEQTAYLRIPTFRGTEKKTIDSVISTNFKTIVSMPNLIIDIRNNGGGSDRSYKELLPILYTNPIRTVGVEMLSTPLNNQRMLDFINQPEWGFDEEGKEWARTSYDKLNEQQGEFVNLEEGSVRLTVYDTIYKYPENIGILINENNGSTAEQFLLAAKQSKKVKLFGTTTVGVLDISNMYFVASPCREFELGYSLSRSMRIPEMTIDGKGIQPDYYLDKEIKDYQWIDFVSDILKE